MTDIKDLSKKLREARAKATSGEWQSEPGNEITVPYTTEMRRMICEFDLSYRDPKGPFDCEFVVLAANNITRILDELDRLIEVEKVLRGALKCNETFHRLGGIDDCDPCLALKRADEIGKGK